MILKTYNIFKQKYNKEIGKQRIPYDNNSHEFLMEKNGHCKQALEITNEKLNCSSSPCLSWIMNPTLSLSNYTSYIMNYVSIP
jgi:hypothetical protein